MSEARPLADLNKIGSPDDTIDGTSETRDKLTIKLIKIELDKVDDQNKS